MSVGLILVVALILGFEIYALRSSLRLLRKLTGPGAGLAQIIVLVIGANTIGQILVLLNVIHIALTPGSIPFGRYVLLFLREMVLLLTYLGALILLRRFREPADLDLDDSHPELLQITEGSGVEVDNAASRAEAAINERHFDAASS